jgi:3-oxoacyl-[acyl-carrier protein] reductase
MTNGKELDGRVAIVTGAARNIGRAIARELAAAGAAVVINARASGAEAEAAAGEIEAAGGRAFACVADVTDEAAVGRMAAAAVARFGRIDILVNNAVWASSSTAPSSAPRRACRSSPRAAAARSSTSAA